MKGNGKGFFYKGIIAAVILLLAQSLYAAQISFMAGDVKVVRNGKTIKAQFQMELKAGDVVKTGKASFADVSYEDGSIIKITENTSVAIGNKNLDKSDSLSVTTGMISAKFAKLEKESLRKVYTPTTVCAVRGTEFSVAVSGGADSRVQLSEGKVEVYNPYGKAVLKENQNAEVNVANAPAEVPVADQAQWKAESESRLETSPEEKSDAFSQYVGDFQKRNESASKNIGEFKGKRSENVKGGKEKLEKANIEIEGLEESVKDDMYLNSAANRSLDGIIDRYKQDKKDMYNKFLDIKKSSNKVLEQQKANYAAIAAIKESYRKAYEGIMKKHKDAIDKIKGGIDTEKVKPKK